MEGALHTIMLPVRGDGKGDNVLAHAATLARRYGSRVRVVHCRLKTDDLMPYGVALPSVLRKQIEEAVGRNADVTQSQLAGEFRALAEKLGLEDADHRPGHPTARFIEFEGKQIDAVRTYGRLADLICVPKPDGAKLGHNTLKSALFSSGRPVMMCPEVAEVNPGLGSHVAIAWNGSMEATRAVGLAMPLIRGAETVTIIASAGSSGAEQGSELRRYLELKGIASNLQEFIPERNTVGAQLLSEARGVNADMLIMGAYHDSYERETIFGGNSQVVVDTAEMPVVFVH